ncbi:MAG: hypothetical protein QXH20_07590 [Candidatus Bathyarchaeia archaeon]
MDEFIPEIKIDQYKPSMKLLREITEINVMPNVTVVQVKVDGEFNYLKYDRAETFTINRWGRMRKHLPCITELKQALEKANIRQAELLVELYAKDDDNPLKLPQFIHYVKSGNPELLNKIHIGVWDVLTIDGTEIKENYLWKYDEVSEWLKECTHAQVLPYHAPNNLAEIKTFWQTYVEKMGYEGIVIRNNSETFKLKPRGELDAVVIAINKKSSYGKALQLLQQGQVTSLHLAIINQQGEFIEIGDVASGIDQQARKALYKLTQFKIAETQDKIWIHPFLIAKVEYTELFPSQNKVYTYTPQGYQQKGETNLVRLRHPRLLQFRTDKKPTPQDAGTNQIPIRYLQNESKT